MATATPPPERARISAVAPHQARAWAESFGSDAERYDRMRAAGSFGEPEERRFDWERPYSREQWLDLLPTGGDAAQLSPAKLAELLAAVGEAIDGLGGSFAMPYETVLLTAVRLHG